jgi:hypothetical protein
MITKSTNQPTPMSYTHFTSTATCDVVENFNLESFLDGLAQRCISELNFIFDEFGEVDGKLDLDFNDYVRHVGDKMVIELDTEECNNNSEVWDWLLDQFLPVMMSKVMRIDSASYDSKSGMESDVSFYTREGRTLSVEKLIKAYFTLQDLNRVPL